MEGIPFSQFKGPQYVLSGRKLNLPFTRLYYMSYIPPPVLDEVIVLKEPSRAPARRIGTVRKRNSRTSTRV